MLMKKSAHDRQHIVAFVGEHPRLALAAKPGSFYRVAGVLQMGKSLGHRGLVDPNRPRRLARVAVVVHHRLECLEDLDLNERGAGHGGMLIQMQGDAKLR